MRILKKIGALGSATILSLVSLSVLATSTAFAAAPYTCTWTGGGDGTSFSQASNWSGCNSSYPQPSDNDNLVFNNTSLGSEPTLNDNISGLSVGNVSFTGTNATYSDQIGGDTITITGGINDTTSQSSFPTGFSNTVIVSGNQTVTTTDNNGTLLETLQGSGNLTVTGGGWVAIAGGTQNLTNYTGNISSTNSVIEMATYSNITSSGSVSVSGDATLDLNFEGGGKSASTVTYDLPISLGGTGVGKDGALFLDGGQDSDVANTLSGPVTLTSNVQVTADGDNTLDITGPITYNGYSISSVGQNVTTINVPSGSNFSSENPNVGSNVTYVDDGTVGNTTVDSGGLLKGNGTVASANVESGGSVAPGHSPGCLTVSGNFTLTGTYTTDIQSPGNTACTDYDQVKVGGTVNLTGGSLSVVYLSGFNPTVGQTFEIIANQGGSPVVGTFSGLPEGDVFAVGSTKLKITYKGDGGNNVVLTVVNPNTALGAPDTGFGVSKASTNPLVLLAGFSVVSGIVYLAGRRIKTTSVK